MRFRVEPRDAPPEQAAKRLGVTLAVFSQALPNLLARGFPAADPDTGNFDLAAIDRWCDARYPHLFNGPAIGPRDASKVAKQRIALMRGNHG